MSEQIPAQQAETVEQEVTAYLVQGGFFNPEMAQHNNVRDLLMRCRDVLAALGAAVSPQAQEIERTKKMSRAVEDAFRQLYIVTRCSNDDDPAVVEGYYAAKDAVIAAVRAEASVNQSMRGLPCPACAEKDQQLEAELQTLRAYRDRICTYETTIDGLPENPHTKQGLTTFAPTFCPSCGGRVVVKQWWKPEGM